MRLPYKLWPDKDVRVDRIRIGRIPALVLRPKDKGYGKAETSGKDLKGAPGVLWIHGGGYMLGMKEIVFMGRAEALVKKYGAVVLSPGYRLSFRAPFPAAADDCYEALLYMKAHAAKLGIRDDQIMVGGESAGGGLAAALCMMARDRGSVRIAFQMPLYPMIDNFDTESSKDNHGRVWNMKKNRRAWKMYLRKDAGRTVSPYAAPARQTDHSCLPPAYTFVGEGEPFYCETLAYIKKLQQAGIPAKVDVYPTDMHAFDMMRPESALGRKAVSRFEEEFRYAVEHYFAPQDD